MPKQDHLHTQLCYKLSFHIIQIPSVQAKPEGLLEAVQMRHLLQCLKVNMDNIADMKDVVDMNDVVDKKSKFDMNHV